MTIALDIICGDKFTKLLFRSVYAIDEMKSIKTLSYPSSFVINLNLSYKPGSHWVAVYFDKNGVGECFDSFACYPPHEVVHFLCLHAKRLQYNRMQVQELYTMMLEVILRKYFSTHNKLRNYLLVRDFVKLHYHHDAKVMDLNFIRQNKENIVSSFWRSTHQITKRMLIIVCIIYAYLYLYLCDTFY